jgi:coenzyme F420-0:L-glutamate ligase/coenzyme F420-1:gamma-L-glutamate ligase
MAAGVLGLDLQAWLRSRRSVRRFRKEAIAADAVERILETATWAPNAHNRQVWRFARLASAESRAALLSAMGAEFARVLRAEGLDEEQVTAQLARSQARVTEAPEAILLCLDTDAIDKYEDAGRSQGEWLMGVQSVALAGGQLLLAAHAEGLAGVWICAPLFVPAAVQQALDLPAAWQAQGLVLLGHAAKAVEPRPRQPLSEVSLTL